MSEKIEFTEFGSLWSAANAGTASRITSSRALRMVALPYLLLCVGQDRVARLFRDHVDRSDDEEARDLREHRGVDDAEVLHADHLEVAVDHRVLVAGLPHRIGARGVVAPGLVLDELADLIVAYGRAGDDFLLDGLVVLRDLADELHACDHRVEVLPRRVVPFRK